MHSKKVKLFLWIFLTIMVLPESLQAAFAKGYTDFNLNDPQRANRKVQVRVWYPAEIEGLDATPVKGAFPAIAFGHGWGMSIDLYKPLIDRIVPAGYIMLMVNTETAVFVPNLKLFGEDMVFALQWFRNFSDQSGTFFEGRAAEKSALMGHSMGGGSAVLSGNNPALVNLLVLLAPADTSPSSSAAAPAVTAPTLLFSGSGDAVTGPTGMHWPIFNALSSGCKYFINIKGGNHCFYADNDPGFCNLLESATGSKTAIERDVQQDIVLDLLIPAMNYFLKSDEDALKIFVDSTLKGQRTEITSRCNPVSLEDLNYKLNTKVYPQPASDWINVEPHLLDDTIFNTRIIDMTGKQIPANFHYENRIVVVDTHTLETGIYLLEIQSKRGKLNRRIIQITKQ